MAKRDRTVTPDSDEGHDADTWSEPQDVEFAQRVLEKYVEGQPEYAIEDEAAAAVNKNDS